MIREFLQRILTGPIVRFSDKYTSRPDATAVFKALSNLLQAILEEGNNKGITIHAKAEDKFIVLSDMHKGAKNGADDFMVCENSYLTALDYYYNNNFHYICLGDCEELWENNLFAVRKNNAASIEKEKQFIQRDALTKVFGNHDLFWDQDPFAPLQLKSMYDTDVKIYEGIILKIQAAQKEATIFLTHGHQGDKQSDGNWFSKFFVSRIWGPLQSFLCINPNTPAYNSQLKTLHNSLMYQWASEQKDLLLITGHTHQPVFDSLTLIEKMFIQLDAARAKNETALIAPLEAEIKNRKWEQPVVTGVYEKILPVYFNSGCCCFSDGDISGIEIENGCIRLIQWKLNNNIPERKVLEERAL